MKYNSEDEVKQALGIDTFRSLSRDKVVRFATMMPDIDKEVQLKIVEQFPEFKAFAVDAVNTLEHEHEATLDANAESQDKVHSAYQHVRDILAGQLGRDDLNREDWRHLIDLIAESANREFEKDTENKRFLDGLFSKAAIVTGGAVLAGVVFVGGRVMLQRGLGSNLAK